MTVSLVLVIVAVAYLIYLYNSLVVARQRVKEGWSDIDTQLKRRYDLIPNLVETVKGYAKHESQTLENVIAARNVAMNTAGHGEEKAKAENMLTDSLKSIFALSENYPERIFALLAVCSGIAGNCTDRIFRGEVVDFLLFYVGRYHWPAFNVADICISCGVFVFVLSSLFRPDRKKKLAEQ